MLSGDFRNSGMGKCPFESQTGNCALREKEMMYAYSDRNDCKGLPKAAFNVWKLTTNNVISKAPALTATNVHIDMLVRY